jgi:hypothetical protein
MSTTKKRAGFVRERIVNPRAISFLLVLILAIIACTASASAYNVFDGTVSDGGKSSIWTFNVSCDAGDPNQISHFTVAWCGDVPDIESVTVDGIKVNWDFGYYPKDSMHGIRIFDRIKQGTTKLVRITLYGTTYGTANTVASTIFSGSNSNGPYYIYGPVASLPTCSEISSPIAGLNIEVYADSVFNWDTKTCTPTNNQYIHITNTEGSKSVDIRVYAHVFTCAEVQDLLNGLDLTTFETLPAVIELDYSDGGVDLRVSRVEGTLDLTVINLQLITGTGSFARSDLNINCDEGDDDDECFDERIIVGVSLVTRMVQSYGDQPLAFDSICITNEDATFVEYMSGGCDGYGELKLTVELDALVQQPSGVLLENVSAADFVTTGFGSPLDWGDAAPDYTFISCSAETNGKTTVYVKYYLNENALKPNLTLELDPPSPPNSAATIAGAGSYLSWGSPPDYDLMKVNETTDGDGKKILTVEYFLPENHDTPSLTLVLDPPSPPNSAATIAGAGSYLGWGSPPDYDLMKVNETTDGDGKKILTVEYFLPENHDTPSLTLVLDPPSPPNSAATIAGAGSYLGWGSPPDYDLMKVNETTDGDGKKILTVEYFLLGDTTGTPSLTLELDPPSPENTAAVTAGAGSYFGWGSPPKYERMMSKEETNEATGKITLYVYYYLNESDPDNEPSLVLELDPPSPPNTAAVTAGAGSYLGWGSPPKYDRMVSNESTINGKTTLYVYYYLNESDPDNEPSLVLKLDPPSPQVIAAITSASGSYDAWGSPPGFSKLEFEEQGEYLLGNFYNGTGDLVFTVNYTHALLYSLHWDPLKLSVSLDVLSNYTDFNEIIENFDAVSFEATAGGDVLIALYDEFGIIATESFSTDLSVEQFRTNFSKFIKANMFKEVYVDIKPVQCPSPIETTGTGLIEVAVMGKTKDFDVHAINASTIRLSRPGVKAGVAPRSWSYKDVAKPNIDPDPCSCTVSGKDGNMDLVLKFDNPELVTTLNLTNINEGTTITLTLTGKLNDGSRIRGFGCIMIKSGGKGSN